MAFDGLVNYTISNELKDHIVGGKIDKIFEPNDHEILLGVYCGGIKYALNVVVSSNYYRVCLTNSAKQNPTFAPNFCMVLRKHLLNTRITNIYTLSLERIMIIEFEGHNKSGDFSTKKLIIELMGKHSNIILVNSDNIIIDALKHFRIDSNSYRNILPNFLYILPVSNKLDFVSIKNPDDFYNSTLEYCQEHLSINNFSDDLKLADIISNTYTGISKVSILSILHQLKLQDSFTKDGSYKLYNYLNDAIQCPSHTSINFVDNNDYSIYLSDTDKINSLQANFFIDDYYSKKENSEAFITYQNNFSRLILNYMKKLNNKLSNINNKLKECQNTDLYRLYGELITNNLYRISNTHLNNIALENYYENNQLITIPLDSTLSPSDNAKKYFKKYHKLKNAKKIVEIQKEEVETEIDYLESIIYEFETAKTISDIDDIYSEFSENFLNIHSSTQQKKTKKHSKKDSKAISKIGEPLKFTIDGFLILVGKNNRQNDYITKQANPEDIWFHTKDIHGSHTILKTENRVPSQETINKCAALAAFYSKGSNSSNVSVDYTYAKYVKKPSKSKPGMVIYTNQKNVIVKPQKNQV
mgnify:FL=1